MLSTEIKNFEGFLLDKNDKMDDKKDIVNDQIDIMSLVLKIFTSLKPIADSRSFSFEMKENANLKEFELLIHKLQSSTNCSAIIKANTLTFI